MPSPELVIYGASGLVGRACVALAPSARVAGRRDAPLEDPAALARAFAGASVVVNAAGPLRICGEPVLVAALAAGAHYVDVGGEQGVLHAMYERHESTARRAGLVALPGAGLDCVIGDLACEWAAAHVCGAVDGDARAVREAPGPRLAEDRPLDELAVSYVYDDLALSAGSQRALFGSVGTKPLAWRRDRWEPARVGERRRVNAGASFGGEREAIAYAAGDVITVPRHISAQLVATYASTSRRGSRITSLLARALPLVPRAASELLAPFATPEADCARTRFAIVAQARRGFAQAQVVVRGGDPYRTTAVIAMWCARAIAARGAGPIGMRAPGELFRAEPALRELAALADLVIEPSFG
jgi:hypothetical protein